MPYGLWFGPWALTATAMLRQACFVLQCDGTNSERGMGCVLVRKILEALNSVDLSTYFSKVYKRKLY